MTGPETHRRLGKSATPAERLNYRLEVRANGCREWTGFTNPLGYGMIKVDGKSTLAHRLAWTLNKGPIPPGIKVLHRCDNPPCAETDPSDAYPDGHLFLGTDADNVADREAKGRGKSGDGTHCPSDHEYTEANTYVDKNGWKYCRTCGRAANARYLAKKKRSRA